MTNPSILKNRTPAPEPLLVNEREAARLLGGLSVKTLFNMRKRGELAAVRIGGRVMYRVADLQALVERQAISG